jgi:hypothetical protein
MATIIGLYTNVPSEIRIDTDQKSGGSFSKKFQRIGNQTEPAPLALKGPLLLKLQ